MEDKLYFCRACDEPVYYEDLPLENELGSLLVNSGWGAENCLDERNELLGWPGLQILGEEAIYVECEFRGVVGKYDLRRSDCQLSVLLSRLKGEQAIAH